ncbi:MAG: LysR family transcriptional regulator [Alphaproteobacteria bacterium]|nr:LysR family transcriptional regulator [Alphaproteobacteria bacterium]
MEMHQIRYFLALCETRNFTKAADRCNVTQPALTRAIQGLEHEFRGSLFDRDRGCVRLTPLGNLVRQHLAQVDVHTTAARAAAKRFQAGAGGVLRLGVSTLVGGEGLAGLLAGFVRDHADAQFELRERSQGEVFQGLADGDHELGLVSLNRPRPAPARGSLPEPGSAPDPPRRARALSARGRLRQGRGGAAHGGDADTPCRDGGRLSRTPQPCVDRSGCGS